MSKTVIIRPDYDGLKEFEHIVEFRIGNKLLDSKRLTTEEYYGLTMHWNLSDILKTQEPLVIDATELETMLNEGSMYFATNDGDQTNFELIFEELMKIHE